MRSTLHRWAAAATVAALLTSLGALAASGAIPHAWLYLDDNAIPSAAMTTNEPPGGALPNHDPGRDSERGLLLVKTDGGVGENDPTKYQSWRAEPPSPTLALTRVVIWAAMKDFASDKDGELGVYLLDCGSSCSVIATRTVAVNGKKNWTRKTINFGVEHTFASGNELVVKIVVSDNSEDDMWLAYGTWTYAAYLLVEPLGAPESTSTTMTTMTTMTTTTTTAPVETTTSTAPVTTTSLIEGAPTSTAAAESTTTTLAGGAAVVSSTSSTTPSTSSTTAAPLSAQVSGPPSVDSPAIALDFSVPNVVSSTDRSTLTGEIVETAELSPQEGLTVAFSILTHSFGSYLLSALALVGLALVLLVLGLSTPDDPEEILGSTPDEPGEWWFKG